MVEAVKEAPAVALEHPGRFKIGQKVYVDNTPMTGIIVKIDHGKKTGYPTKYHIRMKGRWPKLIKRAEKDLSSKPEYSYIYGSTAWDLNPQERKGGIITFMGILPTTPGLYLTTNSHDCPEKTKILITIYEDGTFSTYCPGCGDSPVVLYDQGQFSFHRSKYIHFPNPSDENIIVTSQKRYCDFCQQEGKKELALYDGATTLGPWANMCKMHFQMYGIGLGLGKGQQFQYQPESVAKAPPAEEPPKKGEQILVIRGGRVRSLKEGLTQEQIDDYFKKYPDAYRCTKPPTTETMMRWEESGIARATDGCKVEPDGTCPHGKPSWLRFMGMI